MLGVSMRQLIVLQSLLKGNAYDTDALLTMLADLDKIAKRPVMVKIDGREVAIAGANATNDTSKRGGKQPKPGQNRKTNRTGR